MVQLAIRGHETRGKEVIEILEMLGGNNIDNFNGNDQSWGYYIKSNGDIDWCYDDFIGNYTYYSIEEFLEKFPYKIGDRVKTVYGSSGKVYVMQWIDDEIKYRLDFGHHTSGWYVVDKLQPYKEKTMERKYNVEEYLKVWEETEKGLEVVVNDKFELKEDNGKFYIIKKQLQYPKTYKECCDALGLCTMDNDAMGYKSMLIIKFQELLIARGAYWKIAGEELGLGKPWEPSNDSYSYVITRHCNEIETYRAAGNCCVFEFPTENMRNEFKENFETDLEIIKEFL